MAIIDKIGDFLKEHDAPAELMDQVAFLKEQLAVLIRENAALKNKLSLRIAENKVLETQLEDMEKGKVNGGHRERAGGSPGE